MLRWRKTNKDNRELSNKKLRIEATFSSSAILPLRRVAQSSDLIWEGAAAANLANWRKFGNQHCSQLSLSRIVIEELDERQWSFPKCSSWEKVHRLKFVEVRIVWQRSNQLSRISIGEDCRAMRCLCTFLQSPKNCNRPEDSHVLISGRKNQCILDAIW